MTHQYMEIKIKELEKRIEALEQEPKTGILDKIRAEIMDTGAYEQEVNGKTEFLEGIHYCLGIIDKYKAESEDKDADSN